MKVKCVGQINLEDKSMNVNHWTKYTFNCRYNSTIQSLYYLITLLLTNFEDSLHSRSLAKRNMLCVLLPSFFGIQINSHGHITVMKSVCLAVLLVCVLISVVHGQWSGSYGRGGWGGDYYGGYGLGGGYYGGGLGGWNTGFDRFGSGLLGLGRRGLGRRAYY